MIADAFLLVSYGSPDSGEEVVPFLDNLFAGKNVPPNRIALAVKKYEQCVRHTGRYSPLNEECRALLGGVLRELNEHTPATEAIPKVYWGNLFWHPLLEEAVAEMTRDGIRRAVCFATSAFDSFAGNARYAEALAATRRKVRNRSGAEPPILEKMPLPFEHPLFIEAQADTLLKAAASAILEGDPFQDTGEILVLFSAHSLPRSDAAGSSYVSQLQESSRLIAEKCGSFPYQLVFQSRSPGQTNDWLGPDINDRIRDIAREGRFKSIVVSPLGFFCENMETRYDLDYEVGSLCGRLGLRYARAEAVGASPKICRMIREMIFEQASESET